MDMPDRLVSSPSSSCDPDSEVPAASTPSAVPVHRTAPPSLQAGVHSTVSRIASDALHRPPRHQPPPLPRSVPATPPRFSIQRTQWPGLASTTPDATHPPTPNRPAVTHPLKGSLIPTRRGAPATLLLPVALCGCGEEEGQY
eukprot:2206519-Rhodomonas_salina.1